MPDKVSLIVVHNHASKYPTSCIESLLKMDDCGVALEIILVVCCSEDETAPSINDKNTDIKIIKSTGNNYVKALNAGIQPSGGTYVGVLHHAVTVEKKWLKTMLAVITGDGRIGVIQSKELFADQKTIKSVGVKDTGGFNFHDVGFNEEDAGQYSRPAAINFYSGGAAFFRKSCLEAVGVFDEDFIQQTENIDYSIRCRNQGWKLMYSPESIICHQHSDASPDELKQYYDARNRMLLIGKHYPANLPAAITGSDFYKKNNMVALYRSLVQAVKKTAEDQPTEIILRVLDDLKDILPGVFGTIRAINFFSRLELALGLRKIKIGIYDQAFHFPGGGQRYAATIAALLQDQYDITFIANKDASLELYREWFDLDLSRCRLKIISIPFFEKMKHFHIDEGLVIHEPANPFDIISRESLNYDIFINANMLTKIKPLSALSVFICHFPDREKEKFFSVDQYDYVLNNSNYGAYWLKQKWGIDASLRLYPSVNMYQGLAGADHKSKIILSVARFESSGSKKQLEMMRAFHELCRKNPDVSKEWKFIMAGGSTNDNPYFARVKNELALLRVANIELRINLNNADILKLYSEASIFWHACGLGESDPHLVEHFGMTTVEAMQNYCVPIVINGGGQREIVDHEVNGFLFSSAQELISCTLKVINDDELRKRIAAAAYEKSRNFSADMFKKNVESLFANIENRLRGGEPLFPLQRTFREGQSDFEKYKSRKATTLL